MSEMNSFEAAQSAAAPLTTPTEQAPAAPAAPVPSAPEPEYEIKWNGKTERLPLSRLQEFAQKGYDYTQKMQQLARDRESWTGEKTRYDSAIGEIQQFLQDRQRLKAYLTELERLQGGEPQADGEEDRPLTRAEVLALQQQREQQLMATTEQRLQQLAQQAEVNQIATTYRADLSAHVKSLADQMPELQVLGGDLEDLLKRDVQAMSPSSIEEAKAYMVEVAKQHQARIQKFMVDQRKTAPGPNPALQRGIEPPGGSGPMPPAASPFKSFSDPAFKQQVINDLLKTAG